MIDAKIGEKVKRLRQKNKITLKQLSEKTGLSVGFLSQFERGISTIAIDSLEKIAEIFDIGLDYFFEPKFSNNSVVCRSYDNFSVNIINNNFIVKKINSNLENVSLYPREILILPNMSKEAVATYSHQGEEFLYVIEGILTLLYKNETHLLYPGDSAHYLSSQPHNWTNNTNKTVKILTVSYPNPFLNDKNHDVKKHILAHHDSRKNK